MITAQIVPEDTLFSEPLPSDHPADIALIEPEWLCQMFCPCGCSNTLHIMIARSGRPRWDYSLGPQGELTLNPSIHRTVGCKSHFWVRNGVVDWC